MSARTRREPDVIIYTDGACKGNPGPGGWGVLMISGDHRRELHGGETMTTNNRMELTAAIEALRALKHHCRVRLFTDSNYVKRGIETWIHGWKPAGAPPTKTGEERRPLAGAGRPAATHRVEWRWVKGMLATPATKAGGRTVEYQDSK